MTRRQRALLDFITDFVGSHGFAPSYQEMAAALGTPSKGVVAALIGRLIDGGHLRRQPGRHRNIEIVAVADASLRMITTAALRAELARRGVAA